jgi:hypothetical protein
MRTDVRVLLFATLIVLTGSVNAYAQLPAEDHVAELGVMFWKPSSPVLTLSTDALTGAGVGEVDFVQEFGIEDKYFPEFRASIGRNHKFRASFVTFSYDAETIITRTIVFQGRTFNIGAPAATDIKWNLYKFGYEWDFVSRERGFVGFVADVKYNKIVASIDSPVLASAATTDTTTPVPAIGVIGRGYVAPNVSITAEFTGINISRGEDEVKFLDFDVYGTVSAGRNFGVQGGYRSVVVDYLVEENTGDLKMKGLYFGAVVRF